MVPTIVQHPLPPFISEGDVPCLSTSYPRRNPLRPVADKLGDDYRAGIGKTGCSWPAFGVHVECCAVAREGGKSLTKCFEVNCTKPRTLQQFSYISACLHIVNNGGPRTFGQIGACTYMLFES